MGKAQEGGGIGAVPQAEDGKTVGDGDGGDRAEMRGWRLRGACEKGSRRGSGWKM